MTLRRAICIMLFAAVSAKSVAVEASSSADLGQPVANPPASSPTGHGVTWSKFLPSFSRDELTKYTRVLPPGAIPMRRTTQPYPSLTVQNPNMPPMHQILGNRHFHSYDIPQPNSPPHQVAVLQQITQYPTVPPMYQGLGSGHSYPYSALQSDSPSHQTVVSQQITYPNDALQSSPMPQYSTPAQTSNSQPVDPALLHAPEQASQPISPISLRRKPRAALPEIPSQVPKGISKRSSVSLKQRILRKDRRDKVRDEFSEQQKQEIFAFGEEEIECEHCKQPMKLRQAPHHYGDKHPDLVCKKKTRCNDCRVNFLYTGAGGHHISNSHWDKFNPPSVRIEKAVQRKYARTNTERRNKIKFEFTKQQQVRILAFGEQEITCEHCKQAMTLSQAPNHYRTNHRGMGCKKTAHCDDCGGDFSYNRAAEHHVKDQHWNKFNPSSVPIPGK